MRNGFLHISTRESLSTYNAMRLAFMIMKAKEELPLKLELEVESTPRTDFHMYCTPMHL